MRVPAVVPGTLATVCHLPSADGANATDFSPKELGNAKAIESRHGPGLGLEHIAQVIAGGVRIGERQQKHLTGRGLVLLDALAEFSGSTLRDARGANRASPNRCAGLQIAESGGAGFPGTPNLDIGSMRLTASETLSST